MKKYLLPLAILCGHFCFAQKIKVVETSEGMSTGNNPALTVVIPETNGDAIDKKWHKLMKDYDAKVSSKSGETFADNALIKELGANTEDIYMKIKESDGSVAMWVWVDLGGGFVSSSKYPEQYKAMEKIVNDFAVEAAKDAAQKRIDDATDALNKLNKAHEDLVKEVKDLGDDIEDYKKKITDAQQKIADDNKAIAEKLTQISDQQKVLDALKAKKDKIE